MLKKLQRKFVGIAIVALVIIVFVEIISVNVVNIYQHDNDLRTMLYIITENDGRFPNHDDGNDLVDSFLNPFGKVHITVETPYSTRYFYVKFKGNYVTDISTENAASISDQTAFDYGCKAYAGEPGFGFIDNYRYYYTEDRSNGSSMIVFIDFQKELEETFTLASISLVVAVVFIIILALPVYFLSKAALAPVKKSIEKQKQFITDAGHELKTPIAIISADAEVIELCNGENEWVTSIKNQTKRLDSLVKNLVDLSKLNEATDDVSHEIFNISEAVTDSALNFEPLAKSKGLDFTLNIKPDLTYKGNEAEIRQLISILCDNAVKYASPAGRINISLYRSGKNICIESYNDAQNIEKDKIPKLFDRFYRADSSRSRETGGYGIGLSIAKAIVERHKGKISAYSTDSKSIIFKIIL